MTAGRGVVLGEGDGLGKDGAVLETARESVAVETGEESRVGDNSGCDAGAHADKKTIDARLAVVILRAVIDLNLERENSANMERNYNRPAANAIIRGIPQPGKSAHPASSCANYRAVNPFCSTSCRGTLPCQGSSPRPAAGMLHDGRVHPLG